ncbi:MAG: type III-B CRISPR module-associated Cmr3 family protein [Verrucomicrobiota bacterium JB023]|nr:type III-B CRISPR module-associated Cmr3 family protein [Verrucomicrobiota bacterium JB023]
MEGSSAGHGAAWPMPHVLDAALHAALHRSGLQSHTHRSHRSGAIISENREQDGRSFGSLQSAGPFPVSPQGDWFFPRPADADHSGSHETTHQPLESPPEGASSSLPKELRPVVSLRPPSKAKAEKWLSADAYQAYLNQTASLQSEHYCNDEKIFSAEHNIGIGIDANTGAQDGKSYYSASYLRLCQDWSLGLLTTCMDKEHGDLIAQTFENSGHANHILAGGQQRTCTVYRSTPEALPLPRGSEITSKLVRWTLLSPAIFPLLEGENNHPGGWLPTWIEPESFQVQLKTRPVRKKGQSRNAWREEVKTAPAIGAKLVAALVPPALPVTGWSLGKAQGEGSRGMGAKSTHLAVPAGAVYYFECESPEEARKLADELNWHGGSASQKLANTGEPSQRLAPTIVNRRSSLFGEKGFGLGVCSAFQFHRGNKHPAC